MVRIFTCDERDRICHLYRLGWGQSRIAKLFGCSHSTIRRVLIEELGQREFERIAKTHNWSPGSGRTQFRTGHSVPCEWIRKRVEVVRERGFSERGRRHISQALRGIERSEKWKAKHRGEHHWNWKGGVSRGKTTLDRYGMSQDEWKILAQKIRKRDNFTCQWCGCKRATVVHHIVPVRVGVDNHPDNLITLCRRCHPEVEALTEEYLEQARHPIEVFFDRWQNGQLV